MTTFRRQTSRAFTLIETLVAVSLLTIAVVAPMTLTQQSLSTAYYARDQITAYNLAQEGIESVRALRDGQILRIATQSGSADLFGPLPRGQDFIIDSLDTDPLTAVEPCYFGPCPPLTLHEGGDLYTYGAGITTKFTRTMRASYVAGSTDEIRLSSTVSWVADSGQPRSFTIYENVYRWINDGSAAL